jgi:predicted TIM-barrel fold metal-dependent hydrolase
MFGLAPFENIYFKMTPAVFDYARAEKATPETFFPRMVEVFGSHRLAWGSDYPATKGELSANLDNARQCLQSLSAEDQAWIFGKTAQTLYPKLAD